MKRLIFGIILILIPFIVTYLYPISAPSSIHSLGEFYLKDSLTSVRSPEVVTSILWDYRGLDTIFETAVFFLAIMGGLAIFRELELKYPSWEEFPLPVKVVTKVTAVLIVTVAASLALHGQLTPGGGFQGGSTLAVAPLLVIGAVSLASLRKIGITLERAVLVRILGLTGIVILALIPLTFGGYAVQNQPYFPSEFLGTLLGGSLLWYNIFEFLAVGAGFTAVFLILAVAGGGRND
ncbi:MnhB domain-containing protein [Pyrococcus kukulkanii]|uniref:MnhB domain-containing protein n=1 Tax=Pyrococcus kukulkanii TaxID=1609559 RepID=UPI003564B149